MDIKLTIIDAMKKLNEFAMEVNLDSNTDALIFIRMAGKEEQIRTLAGI